MRKRRSMVRSIMANVLSSGWLVLLACLRFMPSLFKIPRFRTHWEKKQERRLPTVQRPR